MYGGIEPANLFQCHLHQKVKKSKFIKKLKEKNWFSYLIITFEVLEILLYDESPLKLTLTL